MFILQNWWPPKIGGLSLPNGRTGHGTFIGLTNQTKRHRFSNPTRKAFEVYERYVQICYIIGGIIAIREQMKIDTKRQAYIGVGCTSRTNQLL